MRRHRAKHEVAAEWIDDFLQFVMDVGERPSPKHKLFAADASKPIGPKNYVWKAAITQRVDGEDAKTYFNRAQKVYRALRKEAFRDYELKRYYGLTRDEYHDMFVKQNGRCAICGEQETAEIRGKTLSLCVDHDHETGTVRGLLCADCNRALGMFKDSPERLERAIQYLRWPQRPL